MLISTTDRIPGRIMEIKGVIHAAMTNRMTRDPVFNQLPGKKYFFLPWVKFINQDALIGYLKDQADELLIQKASLLGANAVVSVNYKFDTIWNMSVVAYGTAVIVENETEVQ